MGDTNLFRENTIKIHKVGFRARQKYAELFGIREDKKGEDMDSGEEERKDSRKRIVKGKNGDGF